MPQNDPGTCSTSPILPRSDPGTCRMSQILHWNEPGTRLTMQILPRNDPGHIPRRKACPGTLLDAATAACGATPRSCNAVGRCNCWFWCHATVLQRFWTLQLMFLRPRNEIWTSGLARLGFPEKRFRHTWFEYRAFGLPGRCSCCFLATATPQQRLRTLQRLRSGML